VFYLNSSYKAKRISSFFSGDSSGHRERDPLERIFSNCLSALRLPKYWGRGDCPGMLGFWNLPRMLRLWSDEVYLWYVDV
jgi:hypothetical protein